MADLAVLRWIVETDFADIVMGTRIVDAKLRVLITDGSYLDFWWSLEIPGRFLAGPPLWEMCTAAKSCRSKSNRPIAAKPISGVVLETMIIGSA